MNANSSHERPVRLRERLREATRDAILAAAEQAFAADGPKARMESIAERAGIAVGTLYNHFEDREALWKALGRSRREALLARVDAALAASRARPFREALGAFVDALVAHWAEHRAFLTVLVQTEPALPAGKERSTAQEIAARAGVLVRRGVEEGALRPDGADLYATFLVGMLRNVLLVDAAPGALGAAALRERVVEFFLRGAGRRP
jgi:AcrR family transcriptional regulator